MAAPSPLFLGLRPHVLQGLLILVATFWIYLPAFHGGWLWDDNFLITENPVMQDPAGLWKIWFQPGISSDYYPLTSTVEWFEWKLWNTDTLGYHLVNVALHVVSALLVWRLFDKLGLRLAWLGGLLFAIHPIQVESVAWVAELKNDLSLPLFLGAMLAWIGFERHGRWRDYGLALALFFLALLCKLTVVMFPLVILLYAWWRRGRIGLADVKVSTPFFALSLAAGLVPILTGSWAQTFMERDPMFLPDGGGLGRFLLAGQEFAFDLTKSIWPVGLLPVYPKWKVDISSPLTYLPWVALAALLVWFWAQRKRWGRHALLGAGFFLINLLPCPGFIPASNMGYSWVMDHFLYLPIIGLIGLAVAMLHGLPDLQPPRARVGATVALSVLVIVMAWGSHSYAKLYRDGDALWTYASHHNPGSWMVQFSLGEIEMLRGDSAQAIEHLEIAKTLFPEYLNIRADLATAYQDAGRYDDAVTQFRLVAKAEPDYHDAAYSLGLALVAAHRIPEATQCFQDILQRKPNHARAHVALGNIFLTQKELPEATSEFAQAEAVAPNDSQIHFAIGNLFMKANQLPEALKEFQQAAALSPRDLDVLGNLGVLLARMGQASEAAQQFQTMLEIDPNSAAAYTNMGSLFLMTGKLPEAIAQYQKALSLDPDFADARRALARAEAMQKAQPAAPASK